VHNGTSLVTVMMQGSAGATALEAHGQQCNLKSGLMKDSEPTGRKGKEDMTTSRSTQDYEGAAAFSR
jgi:hypothetical protein